MATPATQVAEEVQDQNQEVDESLDNSTGDTPSGDEGGGEADDGSSSSDEYFLTVNDRTRYRTQEEAVEAYNRAGDRISELSPYADLAERYGIQEPTVLEDVLKDYLRLRDQAAGQVRREDAGAPQREVSEQKLSELSQKDRENVEYLKRIGFTPAEAYKQTVDDRIAKLEKAYEAKFGALESGFKAQAEAHERTVIESGQSYLSQQLTTKGYSNDPEVQDVIENAITNWIEARSYDRQGRLIPGSDADKFMKGGPAMQEVVARGLDRVISAMNKMRIQADAKFQDKKTNKVARTAKPLPKGSQHKVEGEGEGNDRKAPRRPGAGGIFQDPDLHDRAYELATGQSRK